MRYRKFTPMNSDADYRVLQKQISGRMTKLRWELLDTFARKHTLRSANCGHDYDCCGCFCGRQIDLEYKQNLLTVTVTEHYNY